MNLGGEQGGAASRKRTFASCFSFAVSAGVILFAAIFAMGYFSLPGSGLMGRNLRLASAANLQKIGLAMRDYREDHGVLPEKFSQLIPKYISKENTSYFYPFWKEDRMQKENLDKALSDPGEVDRSGFYILIQGQYEGEDVIAAERAFWGGSPEKQRRAILYKSFGATIISEKQWKNLEITTSVLPPSNIK